jgi:hypothetical protein
MHTEKTNEVLSRSLKLNIGQYYKDAFEVYKKFPGGFIGMLLVSLLIYFATSFVPLVGFLMLPFIVALLHAGALIVIHKLKNGDSVQFGDFFSGFQQAGPILAVSVVVVCLTFIFAIPAIAYTFTITNNMESLAAFPIVILLLQIPCIVISLLYIFALYAVLFLRFDMWPAMEISRKVVMRKFFPVLGFCLLTYIICAFGILLTFGLGVFFFMPWAVASLSMLFEDWFQPRGSSLDVSVDSFGNTSQDLNTEADEKKAWE